MNELSHIQWRRIVVYCVVLFVVSYGLVGGFLLSGGSFDDPAWLLFAQTSAISPALVAIVLVKWV